MMVTLNQRLDEQWNNDIQNYWINNNPRPKTIELLILIDRRFSRELPIQPDYKGIQVDVYENQKVNVKWNDEIDGDCVYIENLKNG